MQKILLIVLLLGAVTDDAALAAPEADLSRVLIPNESGAALKALEQWLKGRGFEVEMRTDTLVYRKVVLMNITPMVFDGELDRLLVRVFYYPKAEHKGSERLIATALKLNQSQNFLQVFVDDDGDLGAGTSLTFYDELSAREFDAFVDLFAAVVTAHVLTGQARELLQ